MMIRMTIMISKVDKLVLADSVIEQLLVDNDRLMMMMMMIVLIMMIIMIPYDTIWYHDNNDVKGWQTGVGGLSNSATQQLLVDNDRLMMMIYHMIAY